MLFSPLPGEMIQFDEHMIFQMDLQRFKTKLQVPIASVSSSKRHGVLTLPFWSDSSAGEVSQKQVQRWGFSGSMVSMDR